VNAWELPDDVIWAYVDAAALLEEFRRSELAEQRDRLMRAGRWWSAPPMPRSYWIDYQDAVHLRSVDAAQGFKQALVDLATPCVPVAETMRACGVIVAEGFVALADAARQAASVLGALAESFPGRRGAPDQSSGVCVRPTRLPTAFAENAAHRTRYAVQRDRYRAVRRQHLPHAAPRAL